MRIALSLVVLLGAGAAQEPPPNGPRPVDPKWHALVGATVHVAPGKTLEKATVVLREDAIVSVSTDPPPEGARRWPCEGLHVYAGFLEPYAETEAPPVEGDHWNPKVTPRRVARRLPPATAKELRELGFTAAVAAPKGGIFRGRATLVALSGKERPTVYAEGVYQSLAFETFAHAKDGFPTSQMGAIAVLRQGFLDGLGKGETLLFDTNHELECLRAAKIAREAKRPALLLGSGTEFRRLDAIAADGLPVIVPLRFPRRPDASSVGAQEALDLRDLMTWEQAPANAARLKARGLRVALTTAKLKRKKQFLRNLRRAPGLDLAMLTTNPAEMLGVAHRMGTVEKGKLANLVVTDGDYFRKGTNVLAVWIDGERHEVKPHDPELAGRWTVSFLPPQPKPVVLAVDRRDKVKVHIGEEERPARRSHRMANRFDVVYEQDGLVVTLSGHLRGGRLQGFGTRSDGLHFAWSAERTKRPPRKPAAPPEPPAESLLVGYPFGPYALAEPPPQPELVVVRGTLWTCGPKGVLAHGQMEVRKGRIAYVGAVREVPHNALVIEAAHVTPGIVDCHSHTGISKGVNDSGRAVTAEVRIGDVTNPDSISWYRQLAGGVTTVNSLHGSANPIGGQNQVNKIRWGAVHPDEMHFEGAKPGIKFALGENVKQSNWGDEYKTRYPQTRMGVEALLRDRFFAAQEYMRSHDRVDLELEALAEVLRGERWIHCHSYRQDEILMLCRVAEEFGFQIGTFQHVLEGYKVADAIRDHAVGASAFSDWWAYKVEVQDAIPYNGAIMHSVGVNVSFNSDSDDLARRLNVEAAKAVKYGGLPPEEALKFVTLNPAVQLGVDGRVGSLEEGKDADFVVWSGDPLSPFSRCEQTWIDGRRYFSLEEDRHHRERIARERRRLLDLVLKGPRGPDEEEEEGDERERGPIEMEFHLCGECGLREEVAR